MQNTDHPQTNGGRLVKRGDTFDPECHRTTHRLGIARHRSDAPIRAYSSPSCP